MLSNQHIDREQAVSVLVGTLLLIVVVIVGSLAIATILSGVSTQTSKQANPQNQASASSIPVYIAGSDAMLDLDNALAANFEATNPSMAISSNTISPDGVVPALQAKTIDIGALAGGMNYVTQFKNPNVQMRQIGSSAVVVIAPSLNTSLSSPSVPFSYPRLQNDFMHHGGQDPVLIRSDQSGTGDTFYTFLGNPTQYGTENGDAQMINDVEQSGISGEPGYPGVIGYADYGDVETAINDNRVKVSIVPIDDGSFYSYFPSNMSYQNMTAAAKYQYQSAEVNGVGEPIWTGNQTSVTTYNLSLFYPLNYVTLGAPSAGESVFMQWAASPASISTFTKENQFSLAEF